MFDNIGGKIMALAMVLCVIGMVASVIGGIVLIGTELVMPGLVTIIAGCVGSWLGSFCLYGFGHLIECMDDVRDHLVSLDWKTKKPAEPAPAKAADSVKVRTAAPAPNRAASVNDGWMCTCGVKNVGAMPFCGCCGKKRPAVEQPKPAPVQPQTTGEAWMCSCGMKNSGSAFCCSGCGKSRA